MPLINYTSCDEIRGALGVSDEELEDSVISLQLYEDHLMSDLEEVSYDLDTVHATLERQTVLTGAEERFMRHARLFATYSVARALTITLPLFGPRSVEDGKARIERVADPFRDTVRAINSAYERWKGALQQSFLAIGQSSTTSVARPYLASVVPSSDPITGT